MSLMPFEEMLLMKIVQPSCKWALCMYMCTKNQRVQRRIVLVDQFFCIFEIIMSCFVVDICDLVHHVEAIFQLP